MCESFAHGTNWKLFAKTFTAWCFTVFIAGAFSAFFFSAGEKCGSYIDHEWDGPWTEIIHVGHGTVRQL